MPCPCGKESCVLPPDGEAYSTRYNRLCWLYHTDESYRAYWDGNPPPTAPPRRQTQRTPVKEYGSEQEWPWMARAVGKFRREGDKGVGDTAARYIKRFGGEFLTKLYKKSTGQDCGCSDRQRALNQVFPYST